MCLSNESFCLSGRNFEPVWPSTENVRCHRSQIHITSPHLTAVNTGTPIATMPPNVSVHVVLNSEVRGLVAQTFGPAFALCADIERIRICRVSLTAALLRISGYQMLSVHFNQPEMKPGSHKYIDGYRALDKICPTNGSPLSAHAFMRIVPILQCIRLETQMCSIKNATASGHSVFQT